jgi:hypothetical protein
MELITIMRHHENGYWTYLFDMDSSNDPIMLKIIDKYPDIAKFKIVTLESAREDYGIKI